MNETVVRGMFLRRMLAPAGDRIASPCAITTDSGERQAAVDGQHLSADIGSQWRGEEQRGAGTSHQAMQLHVHDVIPAAHFELAAFVDHYSHVATRIHQYRIGDTSAVILP